MKEIQAKLRQTAAMANLQQTKDYALLLASKICS